MRDLQDFLSAIDLNEGGIPDEKRAQFVKKYSKKIEDLKLEIYDGCMELFQIKKDIQLIISSENQADVFDRIYTTYHNRGRLSNENEDQLTRFVIEASNAGIKSAHGYAAIYYSVLLNDVDEATHRYEMMIEDTDNLSLSEAHQLIDFVNKEYIAGKTPTERMMRFVQMVKEHGYDIEGTPQGIIWNKKK